MVIAYAEINFSRKTRMEYEKIGRWSGDELGRNYTARAIDNIGRILAKVGADVDIVLELFIAPTCNSRRKLWLSPATPANSHFLFYLYTF